MKTRPSWLSGRPRRCIHCGEVGARVIVLGGWAHRRCCGPDRKSPMDPNAPRGPAPSSPAERPEDHDPERDPDARLDDGRDDLPDARTETPQAPAPNIETAPPLVEVRVRSADAAGEP